MKKKKISETFFDFESIRYQEEAGIPLDRLIFLLNQAYELANNSNCFDIRFVEESGSGYQSFKVIGKRFETDKEFEKRIEKEKEKIELKKRKLLKEKLKIEAEIKALK